MKIELTYYKNLDGLRGIAALLVLLFHFFSYPISSYIKSDIYSKITEFGQHGVSLFFVLSGFVITRILINNKGEQNYFRQFYWRRIIRIFPLYYGFLFFWYFLMPFILSGLNAEISSFSNQIPFYLYLQNFNWLTGLLQLGPGHYWSLAVEEHFYFIWPLIVYFVPTKYLKNIIITIIILVIPLKVYFLSNDISINKITFTRFDQILLGSLLAYYESEGYFKEKKEYFMNFFKIILISVIPLAIITYFSQKWVPNIKEILKYNILGLIFFSIIGILLLKPKTFIVNKLLETNLLQYLGKISFGIYIWHIFVLEFLNKYFTTEIVIVDLLTSVVMTIGIAHLSFYYFETKFLKYK